MPVVIAPLGECLHVGVVGLGAEHARPFAVTRDALSAQIVEMRLKSRAAAGLPDDACLDGGKTRPAREQAICPHAGDTPAAEA